MLAGRSGSLTPYCRTHIRSLTTTKPATRPCTERKPYWCKLTCFIAKESGKMDGIDERGGRVVHAVKDIQTNALKIILIPSIDAVAAVVYLSTTTQLRSSPAINVEKMHLKKDSPSTCLNAIYAIVKLFSACCKVCNITNIEKWRLKALRRGLHSDSITPVYAKPHP